MTANTPSRDLLTAAYHVGLAIDRLRRELNPEAAEHATAMLETLKAHYAQEFPPPAPEKLVPLLRAFNRGLTGDDQWGCLGPNQDGSCRYLAQLDQFSAMSETCAYSRRDIVASILAAEAAALKAGVSLPDCGLCPYRYTLPGVRQHNHRPLLTAD